MFDMMVHVAPVVFQVVSFAALGLCALAYGARGKTKQDVLFYKEYLRLSKIFIGVATGLLVLVAIIAFVGYSMTPRVIVDSHPVVYGVVFFAFGVIVLMMDERKKAK